MKFLVDGMLGNITRWLRLLGYDVEYEKVQNDNELLIRSKQEKRILLTSDTELFRLAKRRGLTTALVKKTSPEEALSKLSEKFNIHLVFDEMRSRCPTCGFPLKIVNKNSIREKIPKNTYRRYDEFWMCSSLLCSKIYWRGNHWKKISQTLKEARKEKINVKKK
ncbi:Mut7-C RNAse domain-containing protein [[Eubacterium] cellulosolvens]